METQQESFNKLPRNGRGVILFPLPYPGHTNPMLQLGSILHSKGFSITVIHTDVMSPNYQNYPHFDFRSISAGLSETEASSVDTPTIILALNAKCIVSFRDCLARLCSNADQEGSFACLIADPLWYITHDVSKDFKLPTVVLQTNSISAHLVFSSFPILREKGYLPIQDSQSEAPVIEFPPMRVKDIPVFKSEDPENIYKVISGMESQIKASSGMIWNSFQELEQVELTTIHQQYSSTPMFPIGPFYKYFPAYSNNWLLPDQSCISWLDKQAHKSVIYVSFGSLADVSETEFLEMAWGLANTRMPFLWVVRPGLVRGAEWLESLPKGFMEMLDGRGYIVKWAPQEKVLSHPAVGGFWTHGGWNSTLESICEGIPMICQPCFADQPWNARYVSDIWRAGLHLEGKLERKEIERAIRRLMVEADGQEMRGRIMQLKEKVDLCLRPGGSSYQSLERLTDLIFSF